MKDAAPTVTPKAILRKDYKAPDFLIPTTKLHFRLDDNCTLVQSELEIQRKSGRARDLVLDAEAMLIREIRLNGRKLPRSRWEHQGDRLTIKNLPDQARLNITNEIDPSANKALQGLYKSGEIFSTQCEAEGFRRITPYIDRPDNMSVFTVTLEGAAARFPTLLSNGNCIEDVTDAQGQRRVTWYDPGPKPCYLFALVAGDLKSIEDEFVTKSGRRVKLAIHCAAGHETKLDHAMKALKASMKWDEDRYGLEYDLDIFNVVAVDDFNAGAMENTSLNIFNTKYVLAHRDTATDRDFEGVESVIAHEFFHHWTGNRVTLRSWFELTLKEGLTVYRDQEFSSDMNSRAVKRIQDVDVLRRAQFPEDAGPTAHPVRPDSYLTIDNFYTATVYNKGAEINRMLETLLGKDGYRRGVDLFFPRHAGQAVALEQWLDALEQGSGKDLTQFKRWYYTAGTPEVTASGTYDAAAKTFTLTLSQHISPTPGQDQKEPLVIPVRMGLLASDGSEIPLKLTGEAQASGTERVLELTQARQQFVFTDVPEAPVMSLLRGFSAPVKLKTDLGKRDLRFLMSHDSDLFNRWEAGQMLMMQVLLDLVKDHQSGRPLRLDADLHASFEAILDDTQLDPALAAEALTLPGEALIGQAMDQVDVEAIHAAHGFLRKALGTALKQKFATSYQRLENRAAYAPSPEQIGKRALRNTALAWLMACNPPEITAAAAQYDSADNMTDRLAALRLLADTDTPERQARLADFYQRFQSEPLVVDMWFGTQAAADRPALVDEVKELTQHADFKLDNPNRLRSLIGPFMANQTHFHKKDGAGYKLVADIVLQIDAVNAHSSAALLRGFRQWRRFDPQRQALMQAQIERVRNHPGLSKNALELCDAMMAPPPGAPKDGAQKKPQSPPPNP